MNKTVLTLVILLLCFNGLYAQFSGGSGTMVDPYLISNTSDLSTLSSNSSYWSSHFKQTTDINAPTGSFSPIGDYSNHFTGTYNGDSNTINGLSISSAVDYCGLFGYISGYNANGNIINLGITNVNISAVGNVGGLVGRITQLASIRNCYVTGSVTGTSNYVGGLAGYSQNCEFIECYSTGSVKGRHYVGGLVGWIFNETITECHSKSTVSGGIGTGGGNYVGGLVGRSYDCSFYECYSSGNVNSTLFNGGLYVGGLVGYFRGDSVNNCYCVGNVSTGNNFQYVGGLIGFLTSAAKVINCYSSGNISVGTGFSDIGGLIGGNNSSTVSNSFWDIQTSGQSTSAGGTGKTTAEMKTLSTFLSAGWDFYGIGSEGIWNIGNGRNNGYPYLQWEYPADPPLPVKIPSLVIPKKYFISQNYPNPFNPKTNIRFTIPEVRFTVLKVYDALGKEVTTLVNEKLGAGSYEVSWDGTGHPSGVYFYRLEAGEFMETRKMLLLK